MQQMKITNTNFFRDETLSTFKYGSMTTVHQAVIKFCRRHISRVSELSVETNYRTVLKESSVNYKFLCCVVIGVVWYMIQVCFTLNFYLANHQKGTTTNQDCLSVRTVRK